jgi:hypothetical protein
MSKTGVDFSLWTAAIYDVNETLLLNANVFEPPMMPTLSRTGGELTELPG